MKLLVVSWGGEASTPALRRAAVLSEEAGAELHVAQIWALPLPYSPEFLEPAHCERQEEGARKLMEAALAVVEAAGGTVSQTHLRQGILEHEVIKLSRELPADRVILGKRRRSTLRRLLVGCESERIARYAPCPVVLVGEESPLAPWRESLHTGR